MANAKNIIGSNNIKGSNLTETKLKIINNICSIHETDKNYYEIICIKEIENLPSIVPNCKLYLFKYDHNYKSNSNILIRSRELKFIIEQNQKIYYITIRKLRTHLTKKNYIKLKSHDDSEIKKMWSTTLNNLNWKNDYTYLFIYSKVKEIALNDINKFGSISDRIDLDIKFGTNNFEEMMYIYQKDYKELITFNENYNNIDICNVMNGKKFNIKIEPFSNYNINIEFFDGQKFKTSSDDFSRKKINPNIKERIKSDAERCYEFLYQKYNGTKCIEFNDHDDYEDYILILKNTIGNYMFVYYCEDNASCAGYYFILESKVYKKFDILWNDLSSDMKNAIIKAYIPNMEIINIDKSYSESDSEPESDSESESN
jgi:hypothetical protein